MDRRPTTQDISWFLDQNRTNRLDLDPPYQRKSVWTLKDRKFFLDTIFRNYPCPQIFLFREINDDGSVFHHVVDGKQRLETIIQFNNDEISLADDFGDNNYDGKKFTNLSSEQKKEFWNYVLAVEFINIKEGQTINDIFDRVNRNARNLNPQELRHARYSGWFITYTENESNDDFWEHIKISTKSREKRMLDIQFISELLLTIIEEPIIGFSQDYLDKKYAEYDSVDEGSKIVIDEVNNTVKNIKKFILKMEEFNSCITKYGKNLSDFYILWSLIAHIEKLPRLDTFAKKYFNFMEIVNKIKKGETTGDTKTKKYAQYSIGAITDLTPRQSRFDALKEALL